MQSFSKRNWEKQNKKSGSWHERQEDMFTKKESFSFLFFKEEAYEQYE